MLASIAQDLRYATRTLRRDLGFTVFAVIIAGCGIGASASVFSVVNALLLRPLPFGEPDRLVWIVNHDTSGLSGQTTQVNHLLDLQSQAQSLSGLAGYFAFSGVGDNLLTGTGEPERLSGVSVSQNFFDVLGVQPQFGRGFTVEEARWRGPKAVMLGAAFWARRFAANPAVIGTAVTINDEPYTVVGVLPAAFDFASIFSPGSRIDLVFPFPLTPETNRWGNTMAMIGRLKPGVTVTQAQAEIKSLGAQLTRDHSDRNSFEGFVTPLADHVNGRMRLALWVLVAAVGAVMLIVCANLSNLLLARTAARHKEMAIRTALGAGRSRLVGQMLVEGLVLSGAGALLGVLLAAAGTRALASLEVASIPLLGRVTLDVRTLAFTVGIAVITGIVFGLAPALQAPATALHDALKDATRGSTEGRRRTWIRNALAVSEVAFACVLVVGAGLLIRSFIRVLDVDPGFRPDQSVTLRVDPGPSYSTRELRTAYFDDVLRRVRSMARVEAAGITDALPLGRNRTWGSRAKGVTYERGRAPSAFVRVVSDGYLAAMGIPLVSGRDISEHDTAASEPVIVVNETMANALWPGQDPIGQVILNDCAPERRVIGVAHDVRHLALEQSSGNEMYIPMQQCPDLASADLVVRSSLPTADLAASLRATLRPIAPNLVGRDLRPIQQLVDRSTSPRRIVVLLLGAFAAFALLLASLGIYALISYSVTQRTQEIGIRMALGASAGDVQRRVIGQTLRLAAIGAAIGLVLSWIAARALDSLLFQVTTGDPVTFAGVLVVLGAVAILAGYLPARRASRIDPLAALRSS